LSPSPAPALPRVERVDQFRWRVPQQGGMRTDGLIFADQVLMQELEGDQAIQQVANVAHLPGIVGPSIAMPDIHWGYGFPIGGVAAFDEDDGVVSPGGVGYDINCGVRLLVTPLSVETVRPRLESLMDALARSIPSGVGSSRSDLRLTAPELRRVLEEGAQWAVDRGFGFPEDLLAIEGGGRLREADVNLVSERARERGKAQLGTVGSGNHFVEVGYVAERYDDVAASRLGLETGRVTISIHSGSRGLGYQVCDDYLAGMLAAAGKYRIDLPDRQLCCAPIASSEGRHYWGAMNSAANYAFANRQLMAHHVRGALATVFGSRPEQTRLVYDVCHNIAKHETHTVAGKKRRLCVHRKGATRAFPPGHPEIGPKFQDIGQPVLIPGDMGRYSYVLVGTERAFQETFGSCCHGAGRRLSRHKAKQLARPRNVPAELREQGIIVRAESRATVDEELPEAYKDVARVVDVVHGAGIGRKVVQLKPIGVLKG